MPIDPTPANTRIPPTSLCELVAVFNKTLAVSRGDPLGSIPILTPASTIEDIEAVARSIPITIDQLLAEAAVAAAHLQGGGVARTQRDTLQFIVADKRGAESLIYTRADSSVQWSLDPSLVAKAVWVANRTIEIIHDLSTTHGVDIFQLLGLRNLSTTVGEIFARELYRISSDRLLPNPHQDGYPDLIAKTPEGIAYIDQRVQRGQMSDKSFWSPFPFGGVEIKATCGSTPEASSVPKPTIGETRIGLLVGADWKAHHRETNNLIGLFWDFIDGLPTIVAAFFRNDLTTDDWGRIVQPREGGGRTTSVSIMSRSGVKRMGQGWLVLPARSQYLAQLCKRRVFDLKWQDVASMTSGEVPKLADDDS